MDNDIVAWTGVWTSIGGRQVIYGKHETWALDLWTPWQMAKGVATAIATRPWPDTRVTDIRGLTQDEYDMLLLEARARAALGA